MAAVHAADPARAVAAVVTGTPDRLQVGDHPFPIAEHVAVLALGKAAPGMVRGLRAALPGVTLHGLEITHAGASRLRGIVTIHGSHPVPDVRSVIAGHRLLAAAALLPHDVPTVVLVSGGGSSLAEVPREGVTLGDIAGITERLLRCGADIEEINTIRRHLSALKGGGLAAALRGPHVTIAISDVVGSAPIAIASGPTVPDPAGPEAAVQVADRYGVVLPAVAGTPAQVKRGGFVVAADGGVAARAVMRRADAAGAHAAVLTETLRGDVTEAVRWALASTPPGTVGILAGETTVRVTGDGRGGRNQHAALLAALSIVGTSIRFATIGTDGRDGNSTAAGAIVDGRTVDAVRRVGGDAEGALRRHDSHTVLDAIGATVVTGPTGTNVGDVWVVDRSAETRG